jgi:lipid-binding SYLF domain-containing protein
MSWLRSNAKFARGMLIVPELVKAGLVLGGSGGRGVLLVKDRDTGRWSNPVFYTLGSVSFGFQIGVKKSEVIMLVMSDKGIEALYSSSFKLGGEVSVAAGPVGAGAEGATAPNLSADYLSFARSKGVFAGLSLEGAVVKINDDFNRAYYGRETRPVDILVKRDVANASARDLRDAVTQLAKRP